MLRLQVFPILSRSLDPTSAQQELFGQHSSRCSLPTYKIKFADGSGHSRTAWAFFGICIHRHETEKLEVPLPPMMISLFFIVTARWKLHGEDRAAPGPVCHGNPAPVRFDQRLDHAQPQSEAAL